MKWLVHCPNDTSDSLELSSSSSSSVGVDTCGGGNVISSDTSTDNTKVSEELVVTIESLRDNYTRRDAEDVWHTLKIPHIGLPLSGIMSHLVAY